MKVNIRIARELLSVARFLTADVHAVDVKPKGKYHFEVTLNDGKKIDVDGDTYETLSLRYNGKWLGHDVEFWPQTNWNAFDTLPPEQKQDEVAKQLKNATKFWNFVVGEIQKMESTGEDEKKYLALLSDIFTSTVTISDVKYISYRSGSQEIEMVDIDGRFGNMSTSVKSRDIERFLPGKSIKDLLEFLVKNGARKAKREKRHLMVPLYD